MISMQAKLLTMGTASQNSNGRWNASVWYLDEHGERKRKAFSGKTKKAVQDRLNEYVADFHEQVKAASDKCNQKLRDGMMEWLKVFKYPSVQRVTYDRYEKSCAKSDNAGDDKYGADDLQNGEFFPEAADSAGDGEINEHCDRRERAGGVLHRRYDRNLQIPHTGIADDHRDYVPERSGQIF